MNRRAEQAPVNIDGTEGERVESFKFLDVHITKKLSWSKHTMTEDTKLFPLRRLKRSPDPQKVLQLHHQEHSDRLHHCQVWQLLGISVRRYRG
jgi:hypothetical protein